MTWRTLHVAPGLASCPHLNRVWAHPYLISARWFVGMRQAAAAEEAAKKAALKAAEAAAAAKKWAADLLEAAEQGNGPRAEVAPQRASCGLRGPVPATMLLPLCRIPE